jgi:hypothetical protein
MLPDIKLLRDIFQVQGMPSCQRLWGVIHLECRVLISNADVDWFRYGCRHSVTPPRSGLVRYSGEQASDDQRPAVKCIPSAASLSELVSFVSTMENHIVS